MSLAKSTEIKEENDENNDVPFSMPEFTFNSAFFALRSNAVILFRYLLKYIESGSPCVVFSQY